MVSNGKVGESEIQGGQGVPIRKELTTEESGFVLKPRTFSLGLFHPSPA